MIPNDLLSCSVCKGRLEFQPSCARCLKCQRQWPAVLGIPDFREHQGTYVEHDLEQAAGLTATYSSLNRNELVVLSVDQGSFYQDTRPSASLRRQRIQGRQQWRENARVIATRLDQLKEVITFKSNRAAIDVGCGSGTQLPTLATRYEQVIGIDASMSELILAKKLIEELGLTNVQLACAFAEQIPLREQSIDLAISLYVLEHVFSARQSLGEIIRIMKPEAHLYCAVPYRYSWAPAEPHTHVWWVGWLPRKWQAPYVRLFKPNFNYETIHLFSFTEMATLVRTVGQSRIQFFDPGFDRRFPPAGEKAQKIWRTLCRYPILLAPARLLSRKSIHAVVTRLGQG